MTFGLIPQTKNGMLLDSFHNSFPLCTNLNILTNVTELHTSYLTSLYGYSFNKINVPVLLYFRSSFRHCHRYLPSSVQLLYKIYNHLLIYTFLLTFSQKILRLSGQNSPIILIYKIIINDLRIWYVLCFDVSIYSIFGLRVPHITGNSFNCVCVY